MRSADAHRIRFEDRSFSAYFFREDECDGGISTGYEFQTREPFPYTVLRLT